MYQYSLQYMFNDESRTHRLALKQPELAVHDAAMHLIELHFGDSENSLVMPNADATPEDVLAQAEHLGLTHIRITAKTDEA